MNIHYIYSDRGVVGDNDDIRCVPEKYHQYSAVSRRCCKDLLSSCSGENGAGKGEGEREQEYRHDL